MHSLFTSNEFVDSKVLGMAIPETLTDDADNDQKCGKNGKLSYPAITGAEKAAEKTQRKTLH